MNNEPVAWMSSVGGEFVYVGYEPAEGYLAIPLYTHPAKTLTDEEMIKEALDIGFLTNEDLTPEWTEYTQEFIASVRAILRKAQEK